MGQELLGIMLPGAGYDQTYASLSGNLDGSITGAFRQYHDASCSDDHFVATCTAQAAADWLAFVQTWSTGIPAVP